MKRLLTLALALLVCGTVQAGVISVTNDPSGTGRATFGGDDVLEWGPLGGELTLLSNPFNHTSNGGIGVTVSELGGNNFERRDLNTGWGGNFTDGSELLWTQGANGPMTISFATAVQGIGFQINPDFADTTTEITIFGFGNVVLDIFSLTTNNRSQASASFLGFTSDLVDITGIQIGQLPNQDFAINQLSLITGTPSVPEPGSVALVALGLLGFAARRKA